MNIIRGLNDLNIKHILECGQCFRWYREEDGSYTGVIKQGVLNIKQQSKSEILISGNVNGNLKDVVGEYFDLKTDYSKIKNELYKMDDVIKDAIEYGWGIRILNQDPWEMLISFIISAANNIPRISKTIENISKAYGDEILFNDKKYYLFPTPEQLSKASTQELRDLNLGFRDKYVYEAVQLVANKEIDLSYINSLNYKMAKQELMKINGIGAKIADCILLFSMQKFQAFPVDTWIKKVMTQLYNESRDIKKIEAFASNKFGEYAGIAQQYLFYYMREKG